MDSWLIAVPDPLACMYVPFLTLCLPYDEAYVKMPSRFVITAYCKAQLIL
jgi:hypothetical protein